MEKSTVPTSRGPTAKETKQVQIGAEQIVPQYPIDPTDLAEFYGNHIQVIALNDEIYLDICQVQPQDAMKQGSGELQGTVPATVRCRVIISKQSAGRVVEVLNAILAAASKKAS